MNWNVSPKSPEVRTPYERAPGIRPNETKRNETTKRNSMARLAVAPPFILLFLVFLEIAGAPSSSANGVEHHRKQQHKQVNEVHHKKDVQEQSEDHQSGTGKQKHGKTTTKSRAKQPLTSAREPKDMGTEKWCKRGTLRTDGNTAYCCGASCSLADCQLACSEDLDEEGQQRVKATQLYEHQCCGDTKNGPGAHRPFTCEHACDAGCMIPEDVLNSKAFPKNAPACPVAAERQQLPSQFAKRRDRGNVAVLISGSERGFSEVGTWRTHHRHVHQVMTEDGWLVYTFVCLDDVYNEKHKRDDVPQNIREALNIVTVTKGTYSSGIERSDYCFMEALRTEKEDFEYSYFVRTRPDNIWFGDMGLLSSRSPLAITARIRKMVPHSTRPFNATVDYFSVPTGASLLVGHTACTSDDSAAGQIHMRPSNKMHTGDHCLLSRSPCVTIDDQFAIVPRIRAAKFFSSKRDLLLNRESTEVLQHYILKGRFPAGWWDDRMKFSNICCQERGCDAASAEGKIFRPAPNESACMNTGAGREAPELVVTRRALEPGNNKGTGAFFSNSDEAAPIDVQPFRFRLTSPQLIQYVHADPKDHLSRSARVGPCWYPLCAPPRGCKINI